MQHVSIRDDQGKSERGRGNPALKHKGRTSSRDAKQNAARWRFRLKRERIIASEEIASAVNVIEQMVLQAFNVPVASLCLPNRGSARVAFARQVAIYLAHVHAGLSLTTVARLFGRDRTTVAHACALVEDRRDERSTDLTITAMEEALDLWRTSGGCMPARVEEALQ